MNEAFYKTIAEESPTAYAYHKIITDDNGTPIDYTFLEVNPAFEKVTGLTAQDIIGKTIREVLPDIENSSFGWIEAYGKVALTGQTLCFDQYSEPLHKWFRVKAYSNEHLFFIAQFTDISNETLAAFNLDEFFKTSLDYIMITDRQGTILRVNTVWETSLGYSSEKIVGKRYFDFVHPDDVNKTIEAAQQLKGAQSSTYFMNRFIGKKDEIRYIDWKARSLGQFFYGIGRDVTEHMYQQNKLNELIIAAEDFLRMNTDSIDYKRLCRHLLALTDASFVLFNLFSPEEQLYRTAALAGDEQKISQAYKLWGKSLIDQRWPHNHIHAKMNPDNVLEVFSDLTELIGSVIPHETLQAIMHTFALGQVAFCRIFNGEDLLGTFVILMPAAKPFKDFDCVHLYTRQTSLLLARIIFESDLKTKERMLTEAQSLAKMGSWQYNIADDRVTWSVGTAKVYGIPSDITSMTMAEFAAMVYPDDRKAVSLSDRIHSVHKTPYELNFRILTGDKQIRWIHETGQTLFSADGKPLCIIGTIQDITADKISERAIQKLLKENDTIFNGTQEYLLLIEVLDGKQYRYVRCNQAYRSNLGKDLEGKTPTEVWGAEVAPKITVYYDKCLKSGKSISYEETLEFPSGTHIFASTLTPIFENGKATYIVGSRIDITQRKYSEQLLKQNLSRNETLVRLFRYKASSVQDFLDFTLNRALELTQSELGYIYFYDEDTRMLTLNSWSKGVMPQCSIKEKDTVYDLDSTGIWGEAIRQRRTIIINDFSAPNPLKKGYPEGHVRLNNFLTIPIISRDRIVAVVGIANKAGVYTQMDAVHLSLLMENAWTQVERKRAEQNLYDEKERFRITLLSVGDGVLSTDKYGRVDILNGITEQLTGWSLDEAAGKPFEDVFHIIDEKTGLRCESPVRKVIEEGRSISMSNHTFLLNKEGIAKPIAESAAPIKNENGEVQGVVVVFRDVTDEKEKQARIEYLSYHDQLTGMYNRRYFTEELARLDIEQFLPLGIIMADVNGLKLTNDAFGHPMGDRLLQKTGELLSASCTKPGFAARMGGDEFVMVLPNTGEKQLENIVKKIRIQAETSNIGSMLLSVSMGYDAKIRSDQDIQEILKNAEDYMYRRKLFESPGMRGHTINTIIRTLYEKNRREERHSERVGKLAEALGMALSLSDREVSELKMAGLLHDIGKIAIPEVILNKRGDLTETEWNEIKRHPEIGYRILSSGNDMAELAEFVLAHHERWDGAGYPKGISGEQISVQGRILCIADAFDAMTHSRTYGTVLSTEMAAAEILRHAGTQFDPHLATLFIDKVLYTLEN